MVMVIFLNFVLKFVLLYLFPVLLGESKKNALLVRKTRRAAKEKYC